MAKGEMNVNMKKPEVCGPGGVKSGEKTYNASGSKGMRQTYKETGKQGKGEK